MLLSSKDFFVLLWRKAKNGMPFSVGIYHDTTRIIIPRHWKNPPRRHRPPAVDAEAIKAHYAEFPPQGAYISSCVILRGARPGAVILQHPPKRERLGDFPFMKMPSLESEIRLIETFTDARVIAITLNHEGMSETEISEIVAAYELRFGLPVADVLRQGCGKIVDRILETFPGLKHATEHRIFPP